MRTFFNSTWVKRLSTFAAAFTVAVLMTNSVAAHEFRYPYRWYSIYVDVQNINSSYDAHIRSAIDDYFQHTDVWTWYVTGKSGHEVVNFTQGNYGAVGWAGKVDTYRPDGVACFTSGSTNGNCNTTDRKPDLGYITLNSDHPDLSRWTATITRQELGHALGMNHTDCSISSVMRAGCSTYPSTLQPHDTGEVNSWY